MTFADNTRKAQSVTVALFVSDIHLQEQMPATTEAFLRFLCEHAVHARQLYLLGDLFEYWAGDDDLDTPFHQRIVTALRMVSDGGTELFWICGNRDFLIGQGFAEATGATLLQDGVVVQIAGQSFILLHGDAQCTDDTDYMAFRAEVRQDAWQRQFLALPLTRRKEIIDGMRQQSRAAQSGKSLQIMDVNAAAIAALFAASNTRQMIHGHTHRPATHVTPSEDLDAPPRLRHVLPDWDCDAPVPRGGWLSVDDDGAIHRIAFGQATN